MTIINKVLIVVLLLLIQKQSIAQKPPVPDNIFSGYYIFKGVTEVDGITFVLTDTTNALRNIGNEIYWRHNGVDTALWQYNGVKWVKTGAGTTIINGGGGGSTSFVIKDTVVLNGSQLDIVVPHGLSATPALVDPVVNDPLAAVFTTKKDATNITIHYTYGIVGAFIYTLTITPAVVVGAP